MTVSIVRADRTATLVVSGDIDLATSPVLERHLANTLAVGDVDNVIIDLSAVQFLDSSGITVLLIGRRRARAANTRFRVRGANKLVEKILRLTGVFDLLCGEAE
jgi:anti-sigma B factor antagonist